MPFVLNIDVKDAASPLLRNARLIFTSPARRRDLHRAMATGAEALTRTHVQGVARAKHGTASRLGAKPTGFYARAEKAVRSIADTQGFGIVIDHPGFSNAREPREIRPKGGKKYLTIPIMRRSYGRRAGEFNNLFFRRSKKGKLYLMQRAGARGLDALFLLVRSVRKDKDETLLPTSVRYQQASAVAAAEFVRTELARKLS